jgi:hypothetical protein
MGDKLLFLKRIDGLSYDIIEEHNRKKIEMTGKNPTKSMPSKIKS